MINSLRWKLTLTYFLLSFLGGFIYGLIFNGSIAVYCYYKGVSPKHIREVVENAAAQISHFNASDAPKLRDRVWAAQWLRQAQLQAENYHTDDMPYYSSLRKTSDPMAALRLLAPDGVVLQTSADAPEPSAEESDLINRALKGERGERLSWHSPDGITIAVAPIQDAQQQLIGFLSLRLSASLSWAKLFSNIIALSLLDMLIFMIPITLIGLVFGFLTGKSLTNRLLRISQAADGWSVGNFSMTVQDSSTDELRILAERLNSMTDQLQTVVRLRQDNATLEERYRLARDLHDTVKQQLFALSMQVGALKTLFTQSTVTEQANRLAPQELILVEHIEKLAQQSQLELVSIIQELRPASQPSRPLAQTLAEFLTDWSLQSRIKAVTEWAELPPLPFASEIALLRIVQEACSNVARHSHATLVTISFTQDADEIVMTIDDNGIGFDADAMRSGMGLQNVRERAEALPGGWFRLTSKPGHGTRLQVRCRLNEAKKE